MYVSNCSQVEVFRYFFTLKLRYWERYKWKRVHPWGQEWTWILHNKEGSTNTLSKLEGTGQTFRIWKMKKWKQNGYHTSHRSTIHQLKLCKSLSFNICVRAWSCWFPTPNLQLHIFYLYSDKKKIYLPNNHIIEMVPGHKWGIWVTCRFLKWPPSQNRRSR